MSNVTEYSLEEIATFRRGSFPQPYGLDKWYDEINGKPFVQVYDVNFNGKLKNKTKTKISEEAAKLSVFAPKGTIVITIQGSIGKVAITQYDAYIDRTLLIIESFKIPIVKEFFAFIVKEIFESEKGKADGGIIKTINKETLSKFKVRIPDDLNEQNRIVKILSNLDDNISILENRVLKQNLLEKGLMNYSLRKRTMLPVNNFVDGESGNSFPESLQNQNTHDYKFIRVSDMNLEENHRDIIESNNYISSDVFKEKKYKTFKKGTVIFPKVGATILTNKRRIISDEKTICDNNIMGFVPKENCDSLFLYYYLKTIDMGVFTQVGAVPSLNSSLLDNLMFPDMTKQEQESLSKIIHNNDLLLDNLKEELKKLKQLKKGLLNKLL